MRLLAAASTAVRTRDDTVATQAALDLLVQGRVFTAFAYVLCHAQCCNASHDLNVILVLLAR